MLLENCEQALNCNSFKINTQNKGVAFYRIKSTVSGKSHLSELIQIQVQCGSGLLITPTDGSSVFGSLLDTLGADAATPWRTIAAISAGGLATNPDRAGQR